MMVKVFCSEKSKFEHESNQLEELLNLINDEYAKKNELIYILTNFRLANTEIDVLVLTEKGVAIIDLKSYEGKIIGSETEEWGVITQNEDFVPLKANLFAQFHEEKKPALRRKLFSIQKTGNFEHIDRALLSKISCWGYFLKGSTYNLKQVDKAVRIWFDVITADKLLRKISFLDAGYKLRKEDMDAIVNGLSLKESSIKEVISSKNQVFESNFKKELSVFIPPANWSKIRDKIFASNILVIVGDPRVGKTTTTANIVKELKNEGYEVREGIDSLIRQYYSREDDDKKNFINTVKSKNVFIIDDVFGSTEYESGLGNKWIPIIIKLLEININSKFVFTSRTDIFEDFQNSNKELSYTGLKDAFRNSVVEINTSDYSAEKKQEILEKNLEFIQIKEDNKKSNLKENNEKIINELVLPGEIWHLLENVKNNDEIIDIDDEIERAKRQVKFIKEKIKSLDNHKKLFLYNLYINKNFSYDDLEVIFDCLTYITSERNDFFECIEEFEDKYVKIKIVDYYFEKNVKKLEFVHPIYIEAIEGLLESDKKERKQMEDILFELNDIVRLKKIVDWESTNTKYDYIQLYSYLIAIRNYDVFSIKIKDLVIQNLESLSFGFFSLHGHHLELEEKEFHDVSENSNVLVDHGIKYVKELFVNYEKFDDDLKRYINKLFNIDSFKIDVATCFAYHLDPITFCKFQDKLKELRNEETEFLITKSLIKNYESLNKDNKELLFDPGNKKTLLIELLINNYNVLHTDLTQILTNKITELNKKQLIETGKTFFINYSSLPDIIRQKYDIMFDLENKDVIKQVASAFTEWLEGALIFNYDKKYEHIDEKILDLYCTFLMNTKIATENYKEIWDDIYGDVDTMGWLPESIHDFILKKNLKWNDASFLKLKNAIVNNIILLFNILKLPEERAIVYRIAFDCCIWSGNLDLFYKVAYIHNEKDEVKRIFLDECFIWYIDNEIQNKCPYKITYSQMNIIEKLSETPNSMVVKESAEKLLNFIKASIDNKKIEIIPDDYI